MGTGWVAWGLKKDHKFTVCGSMSPGSPFDNSSNISDGVKNGSHGDWAFLRHLLGLTHSNSSDPPICLRGWVLRFIPLLQMSKPRFRQIKELVRSGSGTYLTALSHQRLSPGPQCSMASQDTWAAAGFNDPGLSWKLIPPAVGPQQFTSFL